MNKHWPHRGMVWGLVLLSSVSLVHSRSLEEIQQSGTLRIGIRDQIPPLQYKDAQGRWTGVDGELGTRLATHLEVTPAWVPLRTPAEREVVLSQEQVDVVISSFSVTEDRLTRLAFSNPYLHTGLALMIQAKDRRRFRNHTDLAKATIAVTESSTGAASLPQILPTATALRVGTVPETYAALREGKAHAILNDEIFLRTYAAQHPAFLVLDGLLSADVYAIGMRQVDASLHEAVNAFLATIKQNGTLQALLDRHLITGTQSQAEVPVSPLVIHGRTQAKDLAVQRGDTLAKLAQEHYGNPALWPRIYAANRDVITFASVLQVGWRLRLPAADRPDHRTTPLAAKLASDTKAAPRRRVVASAPKGKCPQNLEEGLGRLKGLFEQGLISDGVYRERQHKMLGCL